MWVWKDNNLFVSMPNVTISAIQCHFFCFHFVLDFFFLNNSSTNGMDTSTACRHSSWLQCYSGMFHRSLSDFIKLLVKGWQRYDTRFKQIQVSIVICNTCFCHPNGTLGKKFNQLFLLFGIISVLVDVYFDLERIQS